MNPLIWRMVILRRNIKPQYTYKKGMTFLFWEISWNPIFVTIYMKFPSKYLINHTDTLIVSTDNTDKEHFAEVFFDNVFDGKLW